MKTVAVILAANGHSSFGMPEALLEYEKGKSFLRWLSSTFSRAGCEPLGVIGPDGEQVRENHPDALLVQAGEDGPVAAVKAGIRAALDEQADRIVVHGVERPAVRASTVSGLLGKLDGQQAVAPEFEGALGLPLVLSREGAQRLLELADGEEDLARLLTRLSPTRVTTKDPGVVVNIDSPDKYERLLGSAPHAAPPPKRRGKAPKEA
jgi:molybdenum cofactor cytidylyltransferase